MASNGSFGYLSRIVSISVKQKKKLLPWYTYFPVQQPMEFSLVGGFTGAIDTPNHWARLPFFSYISFAPSFPDNPIPIPKEGWASLEAAIDNGVPLNDYHQINFTSPPSKSISGATPKDIPNIWQITGDKQPKDPKHGNIIKPTSAQAQATMQKYMSQWNRTSAGWNRECDGVTGGTGSWQLAYPTSSFAIPLLDPSIPAHRFAFTGGVPAAFWLFGGRNFILTPAFAFNIAIGQLDPVIWDTDVFPPFRR